MMFQVFDKHLFSQILKRSGGRLKADFFLRIRRAIDISVRGLVLGLQGHNRLLIEKSARRIHQYCRTVGLNRQAELALRLEQTARDEDWDLMASLVDTIQSMKAAAYQEMDAFTQQHLRPRTTHHDAVHDKRLQRGGCAEPRAEQAPEDC